MDGDRERRIRERAYEIWEREGRPEGREAEHWERAEAEIAAQAGAGQDGAGSKPGGEPVPETQDMPETPPPRRSRAVPREPGERAPNARRKPRAP